LDFVKTIGGRLFVRIGNFWKSGLAIVTLIIGVTISCNRQFAVPVSAVVTPSTTPVTSTNTPTNTSTNTPGPTSTPTNTPTNTFTFTITNTPTNTPTNTITNTPGGPTNTFTNTPTNTSTSTPTNTPTNTPNAACSPTPTIQVWPLGLAAGGNDGWQKGYCPCGTAAVTAFGYAGDTYGFDLAFSTNVSCNDFQSNNYGNGTWFSSGPLNFQAMCATGLECYIWADPATLPAGSLEAGSVFACPEIIAGAGGTQYGGCYNGWINQTPQAVALGTAGTPVWTLIKIAPTGGNWNNASGGSGPPYDDTDVTGLGVDVNMGATNQPPTADFVIDNVQVY
jgi:hypothetical protein